MSKEKFKIFYDKYWTIRSNASYKFRYNIFQSWIEPNSKVLDIGSGDGYLAKLLTDKKNCDAVCLDISEVAVNRIRDMGLKALLGSAEEPLPFKDNEFDYTVASEVIEHIAFSEEAIQEMARVTKKYILLSIPNIAHFRHRLALLSGTFPKQWGISPVEHLRYWSISDFKKMIDSLGLVVVEVRAGSGKKILRDIWPNLFAEQVCFKIKKK